MNKSQIVTLIIVAGFVALLVGINSIEPSRVSERQQQEAAEAAAQIAEAESAEEQLKFEEDVKARIQQAAQDAIAGPSTAVAQSLDAFQVEFTCSNGTFVVEVYPEWAPIGAEQFRKIVEAGIYDEARFFRVVPGFVVQWGIPGDPEQASIWGEQNIKDEPVKASNERGTLTYAMSSAPNSRTTQVYINLGDNSQSLDGRGFAPIGKVVKGMDVVDAINAEYGQSPDQSMIESRGNAYLKEYFPRLDYIKKAVILGDVAPAEGAEVAPAEPPGDEADSDAQVADSGNVE